MGWPPTTGHRHWRVSPTPLPGHPIGHLELAGMLKTPLGQLGENRLSERLSVEWDAALDQVEVREIAIASGGHSVVCLVGGGNLVGHNPGVRPGWDRNL